VRLLLLALGVTVGVAVVLTALAVTTAFDDRDDRAQQREPVAALESAPGLLGVSVRHEVYDGHAWRRVLVANVTANAVRPPGVTDLPGPGESVVSPALFQAQSDPLIHLRLGKIVGVLGNEALLSPTDLISYTGVAASPGAMGQVRSWGTQGKVAEEFSGRRLFQLELLLLVGLPLVMFLQVASRLSAATRSNRVQALSLVGVPTAMIVRSAALEGAVVGALGALVGSGLFATVNASLATSDVLGFTWFPSATAPGPARLLVLVLVVSGMSAWLSARTTPRVGHALHTGSARAGKRRIPLRWAPAFVGLVLLAFVVPLLPTPESDLRANLTVLGVALSSLGVVLLVRPIAMVVGRSLLSRSPRVATRLAVRRLELEPDGGRSVVVAVISLILLAGIAQGVLHAMQETAGFSSDRAAIDVAGSSLAPAKRGRVAAIRTGRWVSGEFGEAPGGVTGRRFVQVFRMPCSALADAVGQPLPSCADGRNYVLQDADRRAPHPLPAGTELVGTGRAVIVPSRELFVTRLLGSMVSPGSIVVTTTDPHYPWSGSSFFRFEVATSEVPRVEALVLAIEPTMELRVGPRDVGLLTDSRLHRGIVQLGLVLGLGLGLLGLVMAAVDRVLERRRAVAALVVVGVPLRTLRWAQVLLLLIPLMAGAAPAILVSALSAHRYLRLGDVGGYYATPLLWAVGMAAAASLAAMATGLVVAGRRPTGPELRRE